MLPTNAKMPTACLDTYAVGRGRGALLPRRPLLRQGFAQILPLLLPQFVHFILLFFFFPEQNSPVILSLVCLLLKL